jgi:hypothetical protein
MKNITLIEDAYDLLDVVYGVREPDDSTPFLPSEVRICIKDGKPKLHGVCDFQLSPEITLESLLKALAKRSRLDEERFFVAT